ncbi:hypothetical protein R6Q57_008248 [Mikania cordata]
MPMGWRLLVTLHRLNQKYGLRIGVLEISFVYQLRTHGYSRFLLQRISGAPVLVHGITMNNEEWRNKFFFVKRSSISGRVPRFESLAVKREDTEQKIQALLQIKEREQKFGVTLRADIPIISPAHSASSQQSHVQMT